MRFTGDLLELDFGLNEIKQFFGLMLDEDVEVVQLGHDEEICLRITRVM